MDFLETIKLADIATPKKLKETLNKHLNKNEITDYAQLPNKPSINGVELVGDKTTSDLKLPKVYNNLFTPSTVDALSANMGIELNNKIQAHITAKTFEDIASLVNSLNSWINGEVSTGYGLYIIQLNVPDFWVSEVVFGQPEKYTYTTDEAFISEIETNGFVRVGTYKVSILETAKVDLADYVKKSDFDKANKITILEDGDVL